MRDEVDIILAQATPDTTNPVADQAEINEVPCITTNCPWQPYFFGRNGNPAKGFDYTYHFFWGLEDIIAVENLDSILDVDNIDVFMVPSGDLAQSMGLPGQADHPEVQKVVDETMRRITKRGRITGAIANKDNVKNLYENGARFFLCDPRPYMSEGFAMYQEYAKRSIK